MSTSTRSTAVTTAPVAGTAVASSPVDVARRPAVVVPGGLAVLAAAVATSTVAAIAHAAGVSFADRSGASIPVAGFATLTVAFGLIGVALATLLARRAAQPKQLFVRITVTLLALSLVPDLISGFDLASSATLIGTHLLAAAIIVPTLARRLA